MQKYRADRSEPQPDGAVLWFADWMGGPRWRESITVALMARIIVARSISPASPTRGSLLPRQLASTAATSAAM